MASAAQDMQIAKDPRDAACSGARVSLALASPPLTCASVRQLLRRKTNLIWFHSRAFASILTSFHFYF